MEDTVLQSGHMCFMYLYGEKLPYHTVIQKQGIYCRSVKVYQQPREEEESLLVFLHQVGGVQGPGLVGIYLGVQELDVVYTLNEECVPTLGQVLGLFSVAGLFVVQNETHHGGVVCKQNDSICGTDGGDGEEG